MKYLCHIFLWKKMGVVLLLRASRCLFSVEAEDGVVVGDQENLVLESDFLLGQELGFGENDYRIVGFERDSGYLILLIYDVMSFCVKDEFTHSLCCMIVL